MQEGANHRCDTEGERCAGNDVARGRAGAVHEGEKQRKQKRKDSALPEEMKERPADTLHEQTFREEMTEGVHGVAFRCDV